MPYLDVLEINEQRLRLVTRTRRTSRLKWKICTRWASGYAPPLPQDQPPADSLRPAGWVRRSRAHHNPDSSQKSANLPIGFARMKQRQMAIGRAANEN
jgi:hypothetical protein